MNVSVGRTWGTIAAVGDVCVVTGGAILYFAPLADIKRNTAAVMVAFQNILTG